MPNMKYTILTYLMKNKGEYEKKVNVLDIKSSYDLIIAFST